MRYAQITPPDPTLQVVSTADAAAQCYVTNSAEYPYLAGLVQKAVELVERELARQLLTATWCAYLDAFPTEIQLERTPVRTVTEIRYVDANGIQNVLPADQYQFDVASKDFAARVQPAYGLIWPVTRGYSRTWPTIEANHLGELPEITGYYNAVQVTFTAGYGLPADVPACIKHAIMVMVADWYRDRESTVLGQTVTPVPNAIQRLLTIEDWGLYT
ncbi:MAG: hypothetical protein ABSA30_00045 [Candidatus Aminicenantales bacterium]|jgi:hypothetical protein